MDCTYEPVLKEAPHKIIKHSIKGCTEYLKRRVIASNLIFQLYSECHIRLLNFIAVWIDPLHQRNCCPLKAATVLGISAGQTMSER